ncbi:hypothetical protein [Stygiolobus caldivivus]|uniref:Uncharacterized protein n=1 Tax=Stygiolobus caldivivus TaxID=2824673 RepID=A0A8D5U9H9_9CREN|nr:hypothetical protein [Stygiolobus caldivivus]BCU71348.1 hypothetical protein KN1_26450 [Stygiolobus caldivivus]
MPTGNMVTFDRGSFTGTIDYDFFINPIKLGASEKEFNYVIDLDNKPEKVYVILNIERNKNVDPKWRLWLNDFSLTKEFRPNIEVEDGVHKISSIIYDISPLVKQGRNEFLIAYRGIHEITLESIGHVVFYKAEKFETRYDLMAGVLILKPGDELKFDCFGECHLVAKNNGKDARLLIDDYQVSGENDIEEVRLNKHGNIYVKFISSEKSKSLAYIYNFYSINYKIPTIDLEVNTQLDDQGVNISIKNLSEVELDKIIVNVLLNGLSINYKMFNNIESLRSLDFKVALPPNRKGNLLIRVVGVKSGFRKTFDKSVII